jgi:hypothetical protein
VVYNRVPKCGSTTTLDIIRFLRKKLHYNVFNDIAPKMKHFMESDEQEYGKKGTPKEGLTRFQGSFET